MSSYTLLFIMQTASQVHLMQNIPDFLQLEASTEQLLHSAGERRRTPQDSSPRSRRNLCEFVQNVLLQNMYPLLSQALRTYNHRISHM